MIESGDAISQGGPAGVAHDRVEWVNYFTGRRVKALPKSRVYDDQKHPQPTLITDAVRVLESNGCFLNQQAVEHHVARVRDARDQAIKEYKPEDKGYKRAVGRYINDHFCFRAVNQRRPVPTNAPGVYKFTPAYSVVKTGRLKQPWGGLQSCSRPMKHAAYSGIPGLRNYDLKGSQLAVVAKELRDANFNPEWLVAYLNTSEGKRVYAKLAGMDVECWKRCLLALVMGAPLPSTPSPFIAERSAILEQILERAESDLERAETMREGFAQAVAPLVQELNRWHRYLIREYIEKNQRRSRKGAYVENRAGMRLYLDELNFKGNGRSAKTHLAAFLLQGQEAAFIHALTVLGPEYSFKPISNEHDGLVVIGEIPESAVKKAASRSASRTRS
ncbi:MAG: hypothetical protein ACLGJB_08875 [Blastocatellia bacterium]